MIKACALRGFPRLYVAASLKQLALVALAARLRRFPRLYVAASLKHNVLGRGDKNVARFPRLYVAASLKHVRRDLLALAPREVFRGFMSRPH